MSGTYLKGSCIQTTWLPFVFFSPYTVQNNLETQPFKIASIVVL